MRVNGARIDKAIILPHITQQLLTRLHATSSLCQHGQEFELGCCQIHLLATPADEVSWRIDKQFAELVGVSLFGSGAPALKDLLDAQDQLARTERLGHVVISAQFEAENTIDFG